MNYLVQFFGSKGLLRAVTVKADTVLAAVEQAREQLADEEIRRDDPVVVGDCTGFSVSPLTSRGLMLRTCRPA